MWIQELEVWRDGTTPQGQTDWHKGWNSYVDLPWSMLAFVAVMLAFARKEDDIAEAELLGDGEEYLVKLGLLDEGSVLPSWPSPCSASFDKFELAKSRCCCSKSCSWMLCAMLVCMVVGTVLEELVFACCCCKAEATDKKLAMAPVTWKAVDLNPIYAKSREGIQDHIAQ